MRYKEIIKVLFNSENEKFIPDGLAYSEAMCMFDGTDLYDSFFLYTVSNNRKKCVAPIALITLSVETGKIVNFKSFETFKEIDLDNQYSDDEIVEALDVYEDVYPEFRLLMGKGSLNNEGISIIRKIYNSFLIFANSEMQNIYRECCPQMFEFIDSNL